MLLGPFLSFTLVNLTKPPICSCVRNAGQLAEVLTGIRDQAQKQAFSSNHDREDAGEPDFFSFIR